MTPEQKRNDAHEPPFPHYESIVQTPAYEFSSLLGDIGGNMGLFIGASLLTIIELCDFTFHVLIEKILLVRIWGGSLIKNELEIDVIL